MEPHSPSKATSSSLRTSSDFSDWNPKPKPKRSERPNLKLRREIKRRDREFQEALPPGSVCAVGVDCFGRLCKHHLMRRRHVATRHDDRNAIILCQKHHSEGHAIGPSRFREKYGIDFA